MAEWQADKHFDKGSPEHQAFVLGSMWCFKYYRVEEKTNVLRFYGETDYLAINKEMKIGDGLKKSTLFDNGKRARMAIGSQE